MRIEHILCACIHVQKQTVCKTLQRKACILHLTEKARHMTRKHLLTQTLWELKHDFGVLNLFFNSFSFHNIYYFSIIILFYYFCFQKQTVLEVLHKLGCGLHENELWALCRECILALHRHRFELREYAVYLVNTSKLYNPCSCVHISSTEI